MKISMGYPAYEDELRIMENGEHSSNRSKEIEPVMTTQDISKLIDEVKQVKVAASVRKYILDIFNSFISCENCLYYNIYKREYRL